MAGEWIAARLGSSIGNVSWCVPRGYAAYARIFHPAHARPYERTSWAGVALALGRQAHPLMQWHALVGAEADGQTGSRFGGHAPPRGELEPDELAALCDCLADHSGAGGDWHVGVWDGWGGLDRSPFDDAPISLPKRTYLHVALPPREVLTLEHPPNILWPEDRAWFVASEIDFDSTLVGGSEHLVQAILACPALEAARIAEDDSLRFDGDRVNR